MALLGAVFLKGFREAIWLSVFLVGAYLLLNLVVVLVGLYEIFTTPHTVVDWQSALFSRYGDPLMMIAVSALVFPKLALGVSGFETGVSVMPLVRGEEGDDPERPRGRIRNTRKLLNAAALTMSFYLIATSFVTIVLIPARAFEPGGPANGRALSYLSHEYLGNAFGTVYDLSTIAILWFAGASAMAGLINVVPRYLPRYGMSPEWGRAIRPLVLVYTAIAFAIVSHLQSQHRRPGRSVRHRGPVRDDLGSRGRHAGREAHGFEEGNGCLRAGHPGARLHRWWQTSSSALTASRSPPSSSSRSSSSRWLRGCGVRWSSGTSA